MKDLVQRILQMDQTAKLQLEQATKNREATLQKIQEQKQAKREQLSARAKHNLLRAEESEKASATEEINQLQAQVAIEKQALHTQFNENKARYLTEILAEILPTKQ